MSLSQEAEGGDLVWAMLFLREKEKSERAAGNLQGLFKVFLGWGFVTSASVLLPKQVLRINVLSIEWKVCLSQRKPVTD